MPLKRNHSFISLFDIRLRSTTDKDVIVLRGTPEEASSALLSGVVVLSVADPLSIRKITLKLVGAVKVSWIEQMVTGRGLQTRPVKFERTVFEHTWNNLETAVTGENMVSGSPNSSSTTLNMGNYELPFETILPGDLNESVEGREDCQMLYYLVATVERGRFQSNMTARKHLRVLRTLGMDAFELTQTVSIENTWPKKLEYAISTSSKAVAIGSHVPVDFTMVPLLKGLKLGQITIDVMEYTNLATPFGQLHNGERSCMKYTIPAPEDGLLGQDQWVIHERIPLPTSLAKCTQDCIIANGSIKVTHKIKFAISLLNPQGHTSELRASLPIYLFISPNVSIQGANMNVLHVPGRNTPEEPLFSGVNSSLHSLDSAPPNYEDRVYDRLWSDVPSPNLHSPASSGASTPLSRRSSFEDLGMTSLDPSQRAQLAAGLRALEQHQFSMGQSSNMSSRSQSGHNSPSMSPFVPVSGSGGSHAPSPDFHHMSRVGSPVGSPMIEPASDIDLEQLSRVPSYESALRSDVSAFPEMAPDYKSDSSGGSSPPGHVSLPNSVYLSAMRNSSNGATHSAPGSNLNLAKMNHAHNARRPLLSRNNNTPGSAVLPRNGSSSGLSVLNRNSSSRSLRDLIKRH